MLDMNIEILKVRASNLLWVAHKQGKHTANQCIRIHFPGTGLQNIAIIRIYEYIEQPNIICSGIYEYIDVQHYL